MEFEVPGFGQEIEREITGNRQMEQRPIQLGWNRG